MVLVTFFLKAQIQSTFYLLVDVIGDRGSEHGKKLVGIKDTYLQSMKAAIVYCTRVRGWVEARRERAQLLVIDSSDTRKSQITVHNTHTHTQYK